MKFLIKNIFYITIFILACQACTKFNTKENYNGLVVSQEQRASWTRNFNPLTPGSAARWPTNAGIYEPLMIYNSIKGKYIPWLSTNHAWNENNDILKLTIRKDVNWSDGTSFSAKDVLFTFNLLKDFPALDGRGIWSYLGNVKLINEHEIEFKFSSIYVPGLDAIVGQTIVPEHIWSTIEDPIKYTNPDPIGTGPFTEILKFKKQVWELGKNPNYWQKGKPKIEKLIFPAFPTNVQATYALINGEVDWAGNFIPAIDRIFVDKNPENHHYWFPRAGGSIFLYPNTTKTHLNNKLFRKALSYAIDRDLIAKVAMYNYTVPADLTALSEGMSRWRENKKRNEDWTEFNPNKSIDILDSLQYSLSNNKKLYNKNNEEISFEIIVVSGWSDWIRAAQIISRNLKEIGINASVRTYDFGAWFSKLQTGDFDLAIAWAEKGNTPYNLYKGLMSQKLVKPIGENSVLNWHRYGDTNIDLLSERYEQTSNPDTIEKIIFEMQDIFIDNIPAIPLFSEPSWGEYNTTRFKNFPNEENPYAQLSPNNVPENLLVLIELEPVK
jgi:peptide/nickel transport system substrate-binding protein